MGFLLFVLGSIVGSFANVVGMRYDPQRFFLAPSTRGRSHCPACGRTLAWYELVPFVSFFVQAGRCRSCKKKISARYPLIELLSGILFVVVGYALNSTFHLQTVSWYFVEGLWLLVFATLF